MVSHILGADTDCFEVWMPKAVVTEVAKTPLMSVDCEQLMTLTTIHGRSRGVMGATRPTAGRVRGVVAPEG